jgi:multidrug/hemolysin transport system ATP-binding protein
MKNIIDVKQVSKQYNGKKVVHQLSFSMKEKEFLALLGPNGAGKSTTIAMLCGLLQKDEGDIYICGDTLDTKGIGIVFQNSVLDENLTLKRNLLLRCGLYRIPKKEALQRINIVIKLCGLTDFINQKVVTLSGGERRKGDIARALLVEPRMLILDEPTTGLDPYSRKQIWDMIKHLKQQTTIAILLTTHYLEEAEQADQILIMNHGKQITKDSVIALKERFGSTTVFLYPWVLEDMQRILRTKRIPFIVMNNGIKLTLLKNQNLLSLLTMLEPYLYYFEVHRGTIEDAFLKIIEEK